MSCFANGCLDEDRETTKKEHTSTLERFDSQSDDEAGNDCHKHKGSRREPSIGEEHAEELLGNFNADAHRAISTAGRRTNPYPKQGYGRRTSKRRRRARRTANAFECTICIFTRM